MAGKAKKPTNPKRKRARPLRRDGTPAHAQIRSYVLERIMSGEWPPNYKIPSEHKFAELFGVNRLTAHHALKELGREGVVTRVRGRGTSVAPPRTPLTTLEIIDIAHEIETRGNRHTMRVVQQLARSATAIDGQRLRIAVGSRLFHTIVLHLENDRPLEIEDRLVNADVVPDFLKLDLSRETAYSYLMRQLPYFEGAHAVRAVEANTMQRQLLDLQPGEPCLELERITWLGKRVVTWVRLLHPGLRFEILGRISHRWT
jgi:GntR family histidine utilization transcriptional repressor